MGTPEPGHAIGVGITHCAWIPERRAELARLMPQLERERLPFAVASTSVLAGKWSNKASAWGSITALARNAATERWGHTLILAEDMLPAIGAGAALRIVAAAHPDGVVTPFSASRAPAAATLASGESWARGGYTWGSAFMMSTAMLESFIAWADRALGADRKRFYEDELLWAWMYLKKVQAWVPTPSLFEHTMPKSSVNGLNNANKVAAVFQEDVTGVDWSSGLERPKTLIHSSRGEAVLRWLKKGGDSNG